VRVTRGSLNIATGALTSHETTTETRRCGVPLFSDQRAHGVCRGCAEGWQVEGNRFATADEIATAEQAERATRAGKE
jgi:hypothetical protein